MKFINCVEGKVEIPDKRELAIPSSVELPIDDASIEEFISEQIVAAFKKCGVDTFTDDPIAFKRSLRLNKVRVENLMFPTEPLKDGLYFYKNVKGVDILVDFVFVPRKEGVDMTNYFGERI